MLSPSPFGGSLYGILEFVLYFRFWGLGGIFSLRNSRALVIASEAKQSLEILNLSLGNSIFSLRILEFPTMSSPSLTEGSLYRILEFSSLRGSKATEAISRNSRFSSGILDFILGILEFLTISSPAPLGDISKYSSAKS